MQNPNDCYIIVYLLRRASRNLHIPQRWACWIHKFRTVLNTSIDWFQSCGLDGPCALPTYLNDVSSNKTNKKVLLRERKRHTTLVVHPSWWDGVPQSWLGGYPYPGWGAPGVPSGTRDWGTPWKGPGTGIPNRKDQGPEIRVSLEGTRNQTGIPTPQKGSGTWDWGTSPPPPPPRKGSGSREWGYPTPRKEWKHYLPHPSDAGGNKQITVLKGTFHVSHSKFALNKDCFRRSLSPELKANPSETGEAVDTVAKQMIFWTDVRKQAGTVQTSYRFIHNKPNGFY